jgi:hypothetical protein
VTRSIPKTVALAVTVALSVLFGMPGLRHTLPRAYQAGDSFPVSTFPMFSMPRPPDHRMTWVRALDAEGKVLGHVPSWVFNPGGMNQAMAHLRHVRPNRPERRQTICAEIARKVAQRRRPRGTAQIQIVDAYYHPEKVFGPARDETPVRASVLVSCPVQPRNKRRAGA